MDNRPPRSGVGACAGVTLVELVVGMGLSSAAMVLAFGAYSNMLDRLQIQRETTEWQNNQGELYLFLERDIKNAGSNPLGGALFSADHPWIEIVPADGTLGTGLRLRTDISGNEGEPDGSDDDENEEILYALDTGTGTLNRWIADGQGWMRVTSVLESVIAFEPRLLDADGLPATSLEAIAQVRLDVVSRLDAPNGSVKSPRENLITFALRHSP